LFGTKTLDFSRLIRGKLEERRRKRKKRKKRRKNPRPAEIWPTTERESWERDGHSEARERERGKEEDPWSC
jgi:hypothetical protein